MRIPPSAFEWQKLYVKVFYHKPPHLKTALFHREKERFYYYAAGFYPRFARDITRR
jgi:hypothetical protein